jgi:hypothetical protein
MIGWDLTLFEPRRYHRVLERLRERTAESPSLLQSAPIDDRVSLAWVLAHGEQVIDSILASIGGRGFRLGPHRQTMLRLGGKVRAVFIPSWPDRILLMVMASVLVEKAEPALSPRVFSFRKGRSARAALGELGAWLRAARRGPVHLWRRDIERYGESIPRLGALAALERLQGFNSSPFYRSLMMQALSPTILEGGFPDAAIGIPSGSPIVPPLENLYLRPLDDALSALGGGHFYARYGDDFLFASRDAAICRTASDLADAVVAGLRLRVAPEKRVEVILDAQRGSGTDWLGMRLLAGGRTGTKPARFAECRRQLRRDIAALAQRAYRELPERPEALLAAGLRELLIGERGLHLTELLHQQQNPDLLRELDRLIAARVVRELQRCGHLGKRDAWRRFRRLAVPSLLHRFREVHRTRPGITARAA